MKKLIVAYRDNDLFARYLPSVWEKLRALKCEISVKAFPPQTSLQDIQTELVSWLEDQVGEALYVSDHTCFIDSLPEAITQHFEKAGIRTYINITLDTLFSDILQSALYHRTFKDGFKLLLEMAVQGRNMTSAHIVLESLTAHLYGFKDEQLMDWIRSYPEKLATEISWYVKGTLLWYSWIPHLIRNHANLTEALAVCSQDESALLIVDRHAGLYEEMGNVASLITDWNHRCLLFCLPFSNAASHLVQQGKLSEVFTTEALVKELQKRLLR